MDLAQLHQERLARQRQQQQNVVPTPKEEISDSAFLDLLFNQNNTEREQMFIESMDRYMKSRYTATQDDYYKVMDEYSMDIGAKLYKTVVALLPDTLSQVLGSLDVTSSCEFYDYPDVGPISEKYANSIKNIERTKSRVEKFLNDYNSVCSTKFSTLLVELNQVIDEVVTLTTKKIFYRKRAAKGNREKLEKLKVRLEALVNDCFRDGLIIAGDKFSVGDKKQKNLLLDANMLIDVVAKENKNVIEDIFNGEQVCSEDNYVCSCIRDNVISSIVLKLGLKEKYLKKDLDFGYIYYEYAAIWNLVNDNLVNVKLFDVTNDMIVLLDRQKQYANKYVDDMLVFVTNTVKKFETTEFISEEIEIRILLNSIFRLIKEGFGIELEIAFETVDNEAASEALARRLQAQNH
jgi:hypothetical protein